MKVTMERGRMVLVPEGPPDELYLEQVLGMGAHGCQVTLVPAPKGSPLGAWGHVALSAAPKPPEAPAS